jgi:hypothetical protein
MRNILFGVPFFLLAALGLSQPALSQTPATVTPTTWVSNTITIPRAGCADSCKSDRGAGSGYGDPYFWTVSFPTDGHTYKNPQFVWKSQTCVFDRPASITYLVDNSGVQVSVYSRSGKCDFAIKADRY